MGQQELTYAFPDMLVVAVKVVEREGNIKEVCRTEKIWKHKKNPVPKTQTVLKGSGSGTFLQWKRTCVFLVDINDSGLINTAVIRCNPVLNRFTG